MGKVFVIGAGCPRGAGIEAPLASDVFRWAIKRNGKDKFPEFTESEISFLKIHLGVSIEGLKRDEPPFEALLARLSQFMRSKSFGPVSATQQFYNHASDWYSVHVLRRKLFGFLCRLLTPPIALMVQDVTTGFSQLAGQITPPDDSVISFNYDTLLEIALIRSKRLDPVWCYGVPFECMFSPSGNPEPVTKPLIRHGIPVVKLHGSINWLRCWGHETPSSWPTNTPASLCPEGTLAAVPADYRHAWAGYDGITRSGRSDFWEILAIPAAADKKEYFQEQPEVWRPLWEKAHDLLMAADEIIVIGYSLPPSDAQSNEMFEKVLGSGRAKLRRLHVADISDAVLERYRGLLAKGIAFEGYRGGLAEFLERPR